MTRFNINSVLLLLIFGQSIATMQTSINDTILSPFYIDYVQNVFMKDSQPFRYIAGSIHPYRIPHELWQDRLDKMWAAGLNAIDIYVFWNEHEPHPGVYDFEDQNDIVRFTSMAQQRGFYVILRPGPYVCAEHDYGGLPWWLMSNGINNVKPRTSEPNYMAAVKRWLKVLMPKFVPLLYKNGGPIIAVQVENEYGSFSSCDMTYKVELRDLFREYLGNDVVLFTTDNNNAVSWKCGPIPGVYATIDFGIDADPNDAFGKMRKASPSGPLINSEFYPGWLDWWGSPHATVATEKIVKKFHEVMAFNGSSLNFYMFIGGTNYGFSNGVNLPFMVQPTTYDYDAPLSEAGDVTSKFMAIRDAVSQYLPLPDFPVPSNSTKVGYGRVQMKYYVPLATIVNDLSETCIATHNTLSFEQLGQGYGFILYMTKLKDLNVHGRFLSIPNLHDRAYIQIGSRSIGVLSRTGQSTLIIDLPDNTNDTLYIFVENLGRINYGDDALDNKGILGGGVLLDNIPLFTWRTCLTSNFIPNYQAKLSPGANSQSFIDMTARYMTPQNLLTSNKLSSIDFKVPAVYFGDFDSIDQDADTFLSMDKFTKGFALIKSNDRVSNLGRYWPNTGPQVTLYTPSPFVSKSSRNTVVLVEFEGSACRLASNCYVEFMDKPKLDSIPNLDGNLNDINGGGTIG